MIGGHLDQQGLRGTQRSGWKDRLIFTFLFPPWREEGWSRGAQGPQSGHASSARRPPPFYPALHIWKYIQLSFINHLNINIFRNIFLLVRIYRKLKSLVKKRKKKELKKTQKRNPNRGMLAQRVGQARSFFSENTKVLRNIRGTSHAT